MPSRKCTRSHSLCIWMSFFSVLCISFLFFLICLILWLCLKFLGCFFWMTLNICLWIWMSIHSYQCDNTQESWRSSIQLLLRFWRTFTEKCQAKDNVALLMRTLIVFDEEFESCWAICLATMTWLSLLIEYWGVRYEDHYGGSELIFCIRGKRLNTSLLVGLIFYKKQSKLKLCATHIHVGEFYWYPFHLEYCKLKIA